MCQPRPLLSFIFGLFKHYAIITKPSNLDSIDRLQFWQNLAIPEILFLQKNPVLANYTLTDNKDN